MIDWNELPAHLNSDGEFRVAARFWDATVRFDVGRESRLLRMEGGIAKSIEVCDGEQASDLHISAPRAEWEKLLATTPRPFYQDLLAARIHHGFELTEGLAGYAAYYPALRRLVEILRERREA